MSTSWKQQDIDWEAMKERVQQLEGLVQTQQEKLQKMSKDLRFFELMLLEEYHLLIRLLGEDKQKVRIHHL